MSGLKKNHPGSDYAHLLAEVKERVRTAQYAALKAVNTELVGLYWDIGRMIVERQAGKTWGKAIVQQLAGDLQREFPGVGGFSASNLWRMKGFFETYQGIQKLAPLVREIGWSHNIVIMERCSDPLEREFYIRMTRKYGWSKNVLIHQIDNQSYEKSLLGQTNFDRALTPKLRARAKLAVKDEYTFDFLELGEEHGERELERALIARIEDFLRAMGSQYRLEIDGRRVLYRPAAVSPPIAMPGGHRVENREIQAGVRRQDAVLPDRAGPAGPAGRRELLHRHHSLQGKEPYHCRVRLARRPKAHRRGHL